jgi:hypothetical protein
LKAAGPFEVPHKITLPSGSLPRQCPARGFHYEWVVDVRQDFHFTIILQLAQNLISFAIWLPLAPS